MGLGLTTLACEPSKAPGASTEAETASSRPGNSQPDTSTVPSVTHEVPPLNRPYLVALGTAQDGGLPHVACSCDHCDLARRDPTHRRRVASLALVLPASARPGQPAGAPLVYLVDATPDLPEQLVPLGLLRGQSTDRVDRSPVDGVFLTHAHMGHYLGLAHFGFEAVHTQGLPVWSTPRMASFLEGNGPWSQLVSLGNIDLRPMAPGLEPEAAEAVPLPAGDPSAAQVTVRAISVPHRDELSDTVAFLFEGPKRRVLYVPDTDSWDAWAAHGLGEGQTDPDRLDRILAGVDVALVDATFFSADELPGRAVESIGHPLVTDSLARFGDRAASGELEVLFTHLNHSNLALDPEGEERRAIDDAPGFRVLEDGDRIGL